MMEQTFCIYCQRKYCTPENLIRHLQKTHPGTHAQVNLAPLKQSKKKAPNA